MSFCALLCYGQAHVSTLFCAVFRVNRTIINDAATPPLQKVKRQTFKFDFNIGETFVGWQALGIHISASTNASFQTQKIMFYFRSPFGLMASYRNRGIHKHVFTRGAPRGVWDLSGRQQHSTRFYAIVATTAISPSTNEY